jgi:hypothetical protein
MSYQFAGFFTRSTVTLKELPMDAIANQIVTPFIGTGVKIHSLIGKTHAVSELHELARKIGVTVADQWLYLTYDCWAGEIDYVYGFTANEGVLSPPLEASSYDSVKITYLTLMSQFGISKLDALAFAPFTRGFFSDSL